MSDKVKEGETLVVNVKLLVLLSVPPEEVATEIGPVPAPAGTTAVILVPPLTVAEADTPLNLTVGLVPKL